MGNKRKNKKELSSRGRSRDMSEKAIMVKRGTCARAKRRRRSGKFDSASNMFDDTAQSQQVRCISSPKMGQPIKRQVQGDRRFRRRQQRRDSNSNRAAAATLTTWSEISTILANWTKVIRKKERETIVNLPQNCSATGELCFDNRVSKPISSASERITSHDIINLRDFCAKL